MKRVALIIGSLGGGGAERVAIRIKDALTDHCLSDMITIMDPSTNNFKYNVSGLKNFGLRERRPLILFNSFSMLLSIPKFVSYMRTNSIETSLSFLKLDNSINVISSIFHKHRCIVSIHSNSFDERNSSSFNKIKMLFLSTLYSRADRIIVVSDDIKKSLQHTKLRDNDIRVIYNPIDIDDVKILSHQKVDDNWYDPSMTYIIAVGRLIEGKGHQHIINALPYVDQNIHLIICGEGYYKKDLANLADATGCRDRVHMIGWQDNPYKYMRMSKIVILMSESEALPTVLIEALVCDRMVISTDCDFGPRELLLGGRLGILLPPYKNPLDLDFIILAGIIEDMLHCHPDHESDLIRDQQIRKFDSKFVLDQYIHAIMD